mmetsp:Transcript_69048/g.202135  ORF Transcript_69048/g.202135 Transcript_69048/m.202135 type:complete len:315 (+) Transcript_69048:1354-2298(+)
MLRCTPGRGRAAHGYQLRIPHVCAPVMLDELHHAESVQALRPYFCREAVGAVRVVVKVHVPEADAQVVPAPDQELGRVHGQRVREPGAHRRARAGPGGLPDVDGAGGVVLQAEDSDLDEGAGQRVHEEVELHEPPVRGHGAGEVHQAAAQVLQPRARDEAPRRAVRPRRAPVPVAQVQGLAPGAGHAVLRQGPAREGRAGPGVVRLADARGALVGGRRPQHLAAGPLQQELQGRLREPREAALGGLPLDVLQAALQHLPDLLLDAERPGRERPPQEVLADLLHHAQARKSGHFRASLLHVCQLHPDELHIRGLR